MALNMDTNKNQPLFIFHFFLFISYFFFQIHFKTYEMKQKYTHVCELSYKQGTLLSRGESRCNDDVCKSRRMIAPNPKVQ